MSTSEYHLCKLHSEGDVLQPPKETRTCIANLDGLKHFWKILGRKIVGH